MPPTAVLSELQSPWGQSRYTKYCILGFMLFTMKLMVSTTQLGVVLTFDAVEEILTFPYDQNNDQYFSMVIVMFFVFPTVKIAFLRKLEIILC